MRGESVGLELTLNYKIAISQNLIFEFVTLDHWDFSHCILTYSYRTKLQALLISVGDCTACPSTEGCLRKYLANFYPKYFCQFVRPLWQADWWPPSANNPTAYSFLPQLSGIGTDGISLSLLKGAQSSELTAMVAVVEQDSNRPSGGHLTATRLLHWSDLTRNWLLRLAPCCLVLRQWAWLELLCHGLHCRANMLGSS